jgi:hypothetical protein
VAFSDQGVALLGAFLDVLFVQAASQLQQVGRAGRLVDWCGGDRSGDGFDHDGLSDHGSDRSSLSCRGSVRADLAPQFLVLLGQATQFDDDLVEKVIDLVLIVSLTELGRLEPFVDYIFRS